MFLIKKQAKQKETKQNKNNKVKRLVMRDSPCEDVLDSPTTAPEKCLMAQCTASRKVLVRGWCRACWEPQEEGMMSTAASFPQLWNQGLIEPVGARKHPKGVTSWALAGRTTGASSNVETCTTQPQNSVPNLRWGCQSHRFCWKQRIKRIEWKEVIVCRK